MSNIEVFLRDASAQTGLTVDGVLARVLHVYDGALKSVYDVMDETTRALFLRLDYAVRIRNPGLHYVARSQFLGYRREGDSPWSAGERSQIFISVLRNNSRLEVVLPVDPDGVPDAPNIQDLRGKGHHGVGDVRVSLRNDSDIDRFMSDFQDWLKPNL